MPYALSLIRSLLWGAESKNQSILYQQHVFWHTAVQFYTSLFPTAQGL